MTSETSKRLRELAGLFVKLGTIGFGGPAAHIAMMEEEVVRRRKWLSHDEFLDLLGATNLIPGPNSTELAIHIGYRRAGWLGLVIAGACFILPAAVTVTAIAWAYVRYGKLPEAQALMYGIKPVIIAIVIQAIWSLSRTAAKNSLLCGLGSVAMVASFLGVNELIVLIVCGLTVMIIRHPQIGMGKAGFLPLLGDVPQTLAVTTTTIATAAPFHLGTMFLFFLKVGSVLFGSGYVLLAFLRSDLVERWGWLTETQLLDAIAVGQFTPGPVLTTATFIGYILSGPAGALLATVGIFLPAFLFVALSSPLLPRIRQSPQAAAFLDGVNVASLALMITVTCQLGSAALVDAWTIGLAMLAAMLLLRWKINSAWLVLGGATIGLCKLWS